MLQELHQTIHCLINHICRVWGLSSTYVVLHFFSFVTIWGMESPTKEGEMIRSKFLNFLFGCYKCELMNLPHKSYGISFVF